MKRWIAFALPVFISAMLIAQETGVPPEARCSVSFPFSVIASHSPSVITNGPYSADVIFTSDKVLASGKHLHREAHGKAYRDSQGRRRVEADAAGGSDSEPKPLLAYIIDPVAGRNIRLDSCSMTAQVSTRQPAPNLPTASVAQPHGASAETAPSVASPAMLVPPDPNANGAVQDNGPTGGALPKKSATTQELGTSEMEGLTVSGTKSLLTSNARVQGAVQSNTAATTTNIEWEARDMGIVVLREVDDPQLGHSITKLMNIIRTEPDPALFQIPSGYKVTENRPQNKEQD